MATRDYSDKQEKRIASYLGGRVQSGSGATSHAKGDVIYEDWLIECKTKTSKSKSHSIQKAWLEKAKEQTYQMGLNYTALAFDFGDGEDQIILSLDTFKELLDYKESIDREEQ